MNRGDWSDLLLFATIAREGSLAAAAKRLGITASAVSHAIRKMEDRLAVRLLNRSTRGLSVTEAGQRLLDRLNPAMEYVADALMALDETRNRPAGTVRVSALRYAMTLDILPRLERFSRDYPDIVLDITVDDGLEDVVGKGFDVGIRNEAVLSQDMISVAIGKRRQIAIVASPAYFMKNPPPERPEDLLSHQCLNYRFTSSGTVYRWTFRKGDEQVALNVPTVLIVNDVDVLLEAALAGAGIASVVDERAMPYIQSGVLCRVLVDWSPLAPANHLYYPSKSHLSPAVRAFIDAIRTQQ